jgi:hypothetical protein
MKIVLYPGDWLEIAYIVKAANNWRCMECQRQCRRPGELYLGWEYTLTVAHLDGGYEDEVTTVAALCVPCHFAYDCDDSWVARRRRLRWRLRDAGQLILPLKAPSI